MTRPHVWTAPTPVTPTRSRRGRRRSSAPATLTAPGRQQQQQSGMVAVLRGQRPAVVPVTMAVLVGLMAGSLRALWPWQDVDRAILAPGESVAAAAALLAVGVVSVLALRRAGEKRVAG